MSISFQILYLLLAISLTANMALAAALCNALWYNKRLREIIVARWKMKGKRKAIIPAANSILYESGNKLHSIL